MYKFSPYTDLALEAASLLSPTQGIATEETPFAYGKVTLVKVSTPRAAKAIGREMGSYITIESPYMRQSLPHIHREISRVLTRNLRQLLPESTEGGLLIAGLGNRYVTPDALGPKVIKGIVVTRHLAEGRGLTPVAAVAPGVMGLTGIETAEIIKGITEKINPSAIIAIDALAARSISRINTTLQLCNRGVTPGGGMGNERYAINEKTMGVPVIAVGVPTVVDALTLVGDCLCSLVGEDSREMVERAIGHMDNMFVTPKEVDQVVDDLAAIIAGGINGAVGTE